MLASMTREGMEPCIAVEGATTKKAVFEVYDVEEAVEEALAPSLRPGQVVVMDNLLSSHKGRRVRELIEGRDCELCCTCRPTTRPSSTPSSRPSQSLCKAEGLAAQGAGQDLRCADRGIEAMGRALGEITGRDASGFFRHCGYHAPAQLL